ncbi:hypothetical protein V2J09_015781 [Rumex salicifolius]
MDTYEKDEIPMLSETHGEPIQARERQRQILSTQSASWSLPMEPLQSQERRNIAGFTGPLRSPRPNSLVQMSGPLYIRSTSQAYPVQGTLGSNVKESPKEAYTGRDNYGEKNDHLMKSGQLGMCSDPYCTVCPSEYRYKAAGLKHKRNNDRFDFKFDSSFYGDSKGWPRRFCAFLYSRLPGIMNPHAKPIHQWNQFFVISCLVSIFIDPVFFFVLSVHKDEMCIVMNWTMSIIVAVFRTVTDFIYLLNIILQFRLAYVAPETRVVGAGDLVDDPKKIAIHYIKGYFFLDLFSVLPLPQIIVLFVLPNHLSSSGANYAKNSLRAAVLVQYIPRLYRFFPLLAGGRSSIGFTFESAWANFVINLLTFVLVGHIVGSFWYLFGLQRVNQCLRDVCDRIKICKYLDCGYGDHIPYDHSLPEWINWNSAVTNSCLIGSPQFSEGFNYGIYQNVVLAELCALVCYTCVKKQISTLAGNQVPSYFEGEVFFTMAIIGLGLLLFALLIGNMQNFLQSLGRRKLEMSLRRRDVEQWMSHRRLPDDLRRRVRVAERYNWAATRGVNEETMMENLAEDLQREIRQHLFRFLDEVRIFAMMEEPILDSIRERLRQKTYIRGSIILYPGGLIEKMVFIVRGKMESIEEDEVNILAENSICGEELLIWYLDHSEDRDARKNRHYGERPYSTKTVRCLDNVEAFILRAEDLGEVTKRFSRFMRNPRVQRAIRYETPYWRCFAATWIQVAWRYRKKRLNRAKSGLQSGPK